MRASALRHGGSAATAAALSVVAAVTVLAPVGPVLPIGRATAQELPTELDWKGAPPGFLYFRYQLLPLMRNTCGSSACHGGFTGGRLHLAPPLMTGEYSQAAAMANYRSALNLVNPGRRDRSLLLLKPLRPDSYDFDESVKGLNPVSHAGPRLVSYKARPLTPERELFDALRDWVKGRRVTNYAPIAFAGRDKTVPVGGDVVLDGSLSYDPNPEDQRRLKFEWKMVTQPPGAKANIRAATKPHPSFKADKAGTYIVKLVVEDPKRRASDASYVVITAREGLEALALDALPVRTTEKHEVDADKAVVSGTAKLSAADDKMRKGVNVPQAAKAPGDALFDVSITRPGKYGLWLLVRDKAEKEDVPRGPVTVYVDNRQQAVLPVPAERENWRLVRYGDTTPIQASEDGGPTGAAPALAAGVWKKIGGAWEEDGEGKRLVATGTSLQLGKNIAELGIDAGGQMIVSATIRPTDEANFRNGFVIFDYKTPFDYKVAGIEAGEKFADQRLFIEWMGAPKGSNFRRVLEAQVDANRDYTVKLELNEDTAVLHADGRKGISLQFPKPFTGKTGLGTFGSKTQFDNVFIWRNGQLVYANGFGDDPAPPEAEGDEDDPTKRLKHKKLLTFRLTPGKHQIRLQMQPGAPDVTRVVVARIDAAADVAPQARKTVRAVYFDLLGRGPTEDELARDAAKTPAQLAKEITSNYEFWEWLYEQELMNFDLVDSYRPVDLDYDYVGLPGEINNRKLTLRGATEKLMSGVYYHARNFGDEEFGRALWRHLFDKDLRDESEFDTVKEMYNRSENPPEEPPAGTKVKKKTVPKALVLFGSPGNSKDDVVRIVLDQPAFAEGVLRRTYKRIFQADPPDALIKKDAATLSAGWKADREVLGEIVTAWCGSPAYLAALQGYRRKTDAMFARGLYVDLLNRAPDFGEFWGGYRILRSLSDSEPMKEIVAGMMVDSEEADFPVKSEIVRDEWLREQMLRFYAREPAAGEVKRLDALFARPECTPQLVIRALITHPEYQMY